MAKKTRRPIRTDNRAEQPRGDPAESEPTEAGPTEREPTDAGLDHAERIGTGPTDTDPAESYATDTDPAESDATDTDPAGVPQTEAEPEPSEAYLAACALVVELIRSGRIITFIGDILLERVHKVEHPGEPEEAVVIRRFCELVVPRLVEADTADTLWKTARQIEAARELIVTDFELELSRDSSGIRPWLN